MLIIWPFVLVIKFIKCCFSEAFKRTSAMNIFLHTMLSRKTMWHSILGEETDYNNAFHQNFNAEFRKASFLLVYLKDS